MVPGIYFGQIQRKKIKEKYISESEDEGQKGKQAWVHNRRGGE